MVLKEWILTNKSPLCVATGVENKDAHYFKYIDVKPVGQPFQVVQLDLRIHFLKDALPELFGDHEERFAEVSPSVKHLVDHRLSDVRLLERLKVQ